MGRGRSGAKKRAAAAAAASASNSYMDRLRGLSSESDINALIEEAANDGRLSNADYERIYAASLERAREAAQEEAENRRRQEETKAKSKPATGTKVQLEYIDFVKKQLNIDLEKARDTYFDNKRYFNIDTREISRSDLAAIKRLAQTTPGGFEVSFQENGAYRLAVIVRRAAQKAAPAKKEAPITYERIPTIFRFRGGSSQATAEQKKQRRETITRFMNDAKEGDIYSVGSSIGNAGGQRFTVTRSRGKLALAWQDSDGRYSRPVQLNRANVEEFISNGATLVSKRKKT